MGNGQSVIFQSQQVMHAPTTIRLIYERYILQRHKFALIFHLAAVKKLKMCIPKILNLSLRHKLHNCCLIVGLILSHKDGNISLGPAGLSFSPINLSHCVISFQSKQCKPFQQIFYFLMCFWCILVFSCFFRCICRSKSSILGTLHDRVSLT